MKKIEKGARNCSNKSKVGRPPLGVGLSGVEYQSFIYDYKRDKRVRIHLTQQEYDIINKKYGEYSKKHKIDRASYLREIIFKEDSYALANAMFCSKLVEEISWIRRKISSITKEINGSNEFDSRIPSKIVIVKNYIVEIKNILSGLNDFRNDL